MAGLVIHVDDKAGRTVSKYGKAKDANKVAFVNDHATKSLEIRIDDATALCQANGSPAPVPITIAAGKRDGFVICSGYGGTEFKYTATLQGLPSEDPIIIVDKYALMPASPVFSMAVAALITGLVVGYLAGRRSRRSASTAA